MNAHPQLSKDDAAKAVIYSFINAAKKQLVLRYPKVEAKDVDIISNMERYKDYRVSIHKKSFCFKES